MQYSNKYINKVTLCKVSKWTETEQKLGQTPSYTAQQRMTSSKGQTFKVRAF